MTDRASRNNGPGTKDYWTTTVIIGVTIIVLLLDAIYNGH